jgi:hypothetical protein
MHYMIEKVIVSSIIMRADLNQRLMAPCLQRQTELLSPWPASAFEFLKRTDFDGRKVLYGT